MSKIDEWIKGMCYIFTERNIIWPKVMKQWHLQKHGLHWKCLCYAKYSRFRKTNAISFLSYAENFHTHICTLGVWGLCIKKGNMEGEEEVLRKGRGTEKKINEMHVTWKQTWQEEEKPRGRHRRKEGYQGRVMNRN